MNERFIEIMKDPVSNTPPRHKLSQDQAFKLGTDFQFIPSMKLGPWTSYSLLHDPKHMGFVLARYKFCAKMLEGKDSVLEVGCGDAFGIPIVAQSAAQVLGIDRELRLIQGNRRRLKPIKNISFRQMDICQNVPPEKFDASYSIDVIEHLDRGLNDRFIANQCACLHPEGVCIVGMPNVTADKYAKFSRVQHINLMSHAKLRGLMQKYFKNVFMFSMNDEVIHTGFPLMAHYLFAMGVGVKEAVTRRSSLVSRRRITIDGQRATEQQ